MSIYNTSNVYGVLQKIKKIKIKTCFICKNQYNKNKYDLICSVCKKDVCSDCIDESFICLSCKFGTINRLGCLIYVRDNLGILFPIKPKGLFLPFIIDHFPQNIKRSFLNGIEHYYFCSKGCTAKDIDFTKKCENNHHMVNLYHKNKKYRVYHLKDNYYRLLDGQLWFVTNK